MNLGNSPSLLYEYLVLSLKSEIVIRFELGDLGRQRPSLLIYA